MKMLLIAGLIYASDFDELLPPHGHFEAEKPASGSWIKGDQMEWRSSLMPYLKNQSFFSAPGWPFRDRGGSRLDLVRGVTNGASCFGYVEEINPKWFGTESGTVRLNPADPPEGFLQELGIEQTEAPLLEDLAWTEKGWFGRIHTHRVAESSSGQRRFIGFMDGHAKSIRLGKQP